MAILRPDQLIEYNVRIFVPNRQSTHHQTNTTYRQHRLSATDVWQYLICCRVMKRSRYSLPELQGLLYDHGSRLTSVEASVERVLSRNTPLLVGGPDIHGRHGGNEFSI